MEKQRLAGIVQPTFGVRCKNDASYRLHVLLCSSAVKFPGSGQRLLQIPDQIVRILQADRQTEDAVAGKGSPRGQLGRGVELERAFQQILRVEVENQRAVMAERDRVVDDLQFFGEFSGLGGTIGHWKVSMPEAFFICRWASSYCGCEASPG